MNNIDKTIFENYETVEAALLNDLATEARTKGSKVRVLKGEGYYIKYDGVKYDVTPDQCRIYKLIRNNYNRTVEHLNSAKTDFLGIWAAMWGERLQGAIARMEIELDICQKYFDAFKAYIIEGAKKEEVEEVETVEENSESETDEKDVEESVEVTENVSETVENEESEAIETSNDKREAPVVEYEYIEGFEDYMVSSNGKVWSLNYRRTGKMKELKPAPNKDGYLHVALWSNGRPVGKLVHRLVAEAFIPNPYNRPEVNHIDEVKSNNCVDNLEWCDVKYNINYGSRTERSAKARINHPDRSKPVLCVETGVAYPSVSEASRQTGIKHQSISACINGKRKTAGGYHWRAVR